MSIRRNFVAAVAVTVLAGVLTGGSLDTVTAPSAGAAAPLAGEPSGSMSESRASEGRASQKQQARRSPANPYRPRTGALISDPLQPKKRKILNQQIVSILQSVPAGEQVRISQWNIDSNWFVRVALAAHRRGVSIQILMSGGVAKRQDQQTGSFAKLKRGFATAGNAKRPQAQRSWIRGCRASCRGRTGFNHAKFLTATKIGRQAVARNVVVISSANITPAAASNQWNDAFTITGKQEVHGFFRSVFAQMAKDRPVANPYRSIDPPSPPWLTSVFALPVAGKDPVLQMLNRVSCRGARGAGQNGRTVVRVAQTAFSDTRGRAIANKLKALQGQGCRTKVVYTLMDREIRENLTSGANRVPTRQLVRDTNGDGFYDIYLHTKMLTISGRYGKDRSAHVVRTGSENWTNTSMRSDEVGLTLNRAATEKRYSRFIDQSFRRASGTYVPKPASRMAFDPFKYVEIY